MGKDVPGGGAQPSLGIGWEWTSGETGLTGLGKRLGPGCPVVSFRGAKGSIMGIHNWVLRG